MKLYLFSLLVIPCQGFLSHSQRRLETRDTRSRFFAGPPQYEKLEGTLREAEPVGKGNVLLHIDVSERSCPIDYRPGHVLALEIEDSESTGAEEEKENGGWLRGPYTVSRATEDTLQVMIKVVGKKSEAFSSAPPGTPIKFGGKFHVPIVDGIDTNIAKRVVLISTGVGVGPCIGAIEIALKKHDFPRMELFACYREPDEVACRDLLDSLKDESRGRFSWKAVLSSETGRISSTTKSIEEVRGKSDDLSSTHYHLIGNAQMVNEWKQGLTNGGIPEDLITIEQYFNHKATIDTDVVNRIASLISSPAGFSLT
mmetsp:Transcript_15487/g.34814  ORF Transcript_15487/g.34814 Transcript_15487/m.34814 type:complete len:312 (-) Transcript_15487:678-1613(-)|eukprot:CAMPEP_0113311378 /NCGR_PEP_ID=MMETSP0010_2-20120614/8640_1 /TAXON_ID=216773 ORGANISM="Corethron hystrix, Strain 308" /NCGR_SAMPLE_ID=MMETSP0010_2 /ASSEMBLY_ACC=CAM_ASM_000155 /LENGTH=311 /DNA_ID=CAMNT_0000167007 /DNA_START=212 /DNA_END=1147 /DNA_ORIENTATION=- /assembly_acc=CAM_ASM_000155